MSFPFELLPECWFLVGPTATGKSAAALVVAEQIGAEILALDSMTLYRGMEIGTAKPSEIDRARVPHHLLDLLDPQEEYSLADYLAAAESAVRQVLSRGRVPLFVGGAGLYLRGLLRGMFEGPAANWDLRRELEAFAERNGNEALHSRLKEIDPALAAKLPPADVRRIIRGLEVFEASGRPLSEQQQQGPRPIAERPAVVAWLNPPRERLYARIEQRVDEMFTAGLVDEVRTLAAGPQGLGRTARQALGYREILDAIEAGKSTESARELIKTRTRQFGKRQCTWFRNLEECRPMKLTGDESAAEVARCYQEIRTVDRAE
ncbi:MAG: tRNA (adenosine(37)-N6)-dimethylallyltransferase MiaA [Planctomycetota bacterium]|nr:tRNA (adenosine(37)-N6)-dimethylallyltransferase MiaA [Planctomycetota bacterium]